MSLVPRNCEHKGFKRVVLKVVWSLAMSLFTRKFEGKRFQESGLKSCVVLGHEFIFTEE